MILPKNIASECVVSYDPSKASSGGSGTISFEHHRRCFFYYFDLLSRMYSTQGLTEPISLVLLSFIHQDVATDGILDETFADIIMAFPNVKIVCIHLLMEPIQLGWYSYQASAKSKVLSLFGIKDADDSIIEYHTLPQLEASSTTSATTKGYCIDEQDLVGSFSATYGYQRKYLPERMGGGWNSRKFKKWQQEVMSLQLSEEHGKSFLPK